MAVATLQNQIVKLVEQVIRPGKVVLELSFEEAKALKLITGAVFASGAPGQALDSVYRTLSQVVTEGTYMSYKFSDGSWYVANGTYKIVQTPILTGS